MGKNRKTVVHQQHKKCIVQWMFYNSIIMFDFKKLHLSLNSFYLVTVLIFRIECQFLLDVNENNACQPENCVIISKCPSVLKLVFKVKSGDLDARSKLLELQCGFEKSLPKVCCQKNQATEAPRVFNSGTVSSIPTSEKPKIRNFNSDVNATTPFTTPTPIEEVEEETTTIKPHLLCHLPREATVNRTIWILRILVVL